MGKEMKICPPFYKIAYSVFFVMILSIIRGVSYTNEIGLALEAPMALLAAVFCTDTYVQEITAGRSEVERLYPMKNRMLSLNKRIAIQEIYLLALAVAGYGLFYIFQKPYALSGAQSGALEERNLFLTYAAAIAVTLYFWGILAHALSCVFRNMWVRIGSSLILWIMTNSILGDKLLGNWNVFSYSFRNTENGGDMKWIYGKIACVMVSLLLTAALPQIIKKRG